MSVIAIIQARMGSTRLPGKVLKQIGDDTMLAQVIKRTQRANTITSVVVATTIKPSDDVIEAECQRLGVDVWRGNEDDVLDRYYQAANAYQAKSIVRITSDCPLIEAQVIDRVVEAFQATQSDYASNFEERTYPRGLDIEVMTFAALEKAWREANERFQRAHVTPYIYQNPQIFQIFSVKNEVDYSNYRWTVDTDDDLAFVQVVYDKLRKSPLFNWQDVLALMEQEPALVAMNQHIQQKSLHEG